MTEPVSQNPMSSMGANPEELNIQKDLRGKYYQALTMYLVSGISKRRIAAELNMSRNTIVSWSRKAHWDKLREERIKNTPGVESDGPVSSVTQVESRYAFSLVSHINLTESLLSERMADPKRSTAEIATLVRLNLDLIDRARIFAGVDPTRGKQTNPANPIPVRFIEEETSQPNN